MHPSDLFRRFVLPAWLDVLVAAAAFIVGEVAGYFLHRNRMAESAIARQQQMTAELQQVRTQIDGLNSKMNALEARLEPQSVATSPVVETPAVHNTAPTRRPTENLQLKKVQEQAGKSIADTQSQLESTRHDLSNPLAKLSGSIARTHEELLLLQKKGERNYYEFDIAKSNQFQYEGPLGVRLRKADIKHQYADLDLIVEGRTVSQKHVNLYQTVMFHSADSTQPTELVINDISKDYIHGYVSSPMYRHSEFRSVPTASQSTQSKPGEQTAQRQTATPPQ